MHGRLERGTDPLATREGLPLAVYLSVALVAGAVIALQIAIMRVFAVGSWAHFGSLVVSLAMLGFGLVSAVMCTATPWFERRWQGVAALALLTFGPLMIVANLVAQQLPFNAIFLVSDPAQTWRLAANFVLYFLPFLSGALFLGIVFLKTQTHFAKVYFADLTGSGLCGLAFLLAMYLLPPENLLLAPLALWAIGSVIWFGAVGSRASAVATAGLAAICSLAHVGAPGMLGLTTLAVSDYKGVSYARKFPDAERIFESVSPFGHLEVYQSSYLHFAPGLSDNAAFNLPQMPRNAYLGMYIDGEGPIGVIRDLPKEATAYFKYLPMVYPYLLKQRPETFVVQFGGGLSTAVALASDAPRIGVAESNPEVLKAFRNAPVLRRFTNDILTNPRIHVVDYDGRLYLAGERNRFDIIDLSLADSAGLSNPGGFAIVEKYAYTREAFAAYMRALKPGGILSVTLWNKEVPPKSALKLYRTMALAAGDVDPGNLRQSFYAAASYLSTTTVLFKRGGFTQQETATLGSHTRAMSFDEIYAPGLVHDRSGDATVLAEYRAQIFGEGEAGPASDPNVDTPAPTPPSAARERPLSDLPVAGQPPAGDKEGDTAEILPATRLARAAWQAIVDGRYDAFADSYVFDTRPLTNSRPYFAAYVKPADLHRVTDRLELLQDEWGYLLIWATLAIAAIAALALVLLPVAFGWRALFSHSPGKLLTIVYFACLGLGYIMVEVALISHFMLALSNATVSASILITTMLVCSGAGAYVSARYVDDARRVMPIVFALIGAMLIGYGLLLDPVLDRIGTWPYGWRLLSCFLIVLPPSFLMGFPMPTAMAWLSRLGKEHMFVWAWGINGCFSVVGAAMVPVLATSFGLGPVLMISGAAYLIAIPAFFAILLPAREVPPIGAR